MLSCLNLTAHADHRFGGLTTSVPDYSAALRSTGKYQSQIAAFCDPGESAASDQISLLPTGRLRWNFSAELRNRLQEFITDADAVHIHGLWQEQSALGSSFAARAGKPYLVSAHGMLEPWAFGTKAWKKKLYWTLRERDYLRRAQCLRALTAAEAGHYRSLGLRTPVAVIPNGVTLPETVDADAEMFLRRFPELRGRAILLFLGRVHPKKGLKMLCDVWCKVGKQYPEAHLVIAGPDSAGYRQSLEQLVSERGMKGRATFTGMLRDREKWAAFHAASWFTLPSFSEGFSVSVLEAFSAGKPAILSRQCYFPEVDEYCCGWTIEPEAAELTAALHQALGSSPAELAAMGLRARSLVADRFTWAMVGSQTAAVLDWILGGGPPPSCVDTAG